MDFTENLKLTQFTENDVTSWLGNYNNDMQKIDNAYGDLTTTTSVSSAELKVLQEKVGTLETTSAQHADQISVNTASIAANALEIQTLETRENSHYDSLTEQIDALAESGESNLDAIKVLQSNTQTIRDIAAVNSSSISKMELRVDALESGAQDFAEETRQTLEDHTTRIGDLESGLTDTDAIARKASIDATAAVTTASIASAQVSELTTTVNQLDTDLESAQTKIASVEEVATTNAENIVKLNSSVATNTASISANKLEITALDGRVEALEDGGAASELTQRVESLETWKGTASTDITTAQTTADSAKTIAENVQSQVSGIKSGAAVPFSFGRDAQGNYGYIKVGADTVTPFNNRITNYGIDDYGTIELGGPPTMKMPEMREKVRYAIYIMADIGNQEGLTWGYEVPGGVGTFREITKGEMPYNDPGRGRAQWYYESEAKDVLERINVITPVVRKVILDVLKFYGSASLVVAETPTSSAALYFKKDGRYYPTAFTMYITENNISRGTKPAIYGL